MCFYLSISKKATELANRYGIDFPDEALFEPAEKFNGFAHPPLPVITAEKPEIIQLMNWGMVPSWLKDVQKADRMKKATLNARSETVFEKPSFREAITGRRCLVPADAYYEWQHAGKEKIPYKISMDRDMVSFAGIYDQWKNRVSGEVYAGFSILTCAANPLMARIHNSKMRMPVILSEDDESRWLNAGLTPGEIKAVMQPYPENMMTAQRID